MTATAKRKQVKQARKTPDAAAANVEFKALVSSLRGSMSWLNITVDKYLTEKHAEADAENAAWENRREVRS